MGSMLCRQSRQFEDQPLEVVIIGAGLGGLGAAISIASSGHRVRVVEQAAELNEVGAGLQITPNGSRLLQQWKLPPSFWSTVAEPTALTVHRYSGEALHQESNFHAKVNAKYGAPFVDVHRADLQRALHARAVELGVKFSLGERVVSMDPIGSQPTLKTASGKTFKGDLVVAADGLWSKSREILLGTNSAPMPTGDLAYRIVLTLDQIPDEDLKEWVRKPTVHFWIGPGAHAVGYSLRGGDMYNIVLLVPDNLPPGVSKEKGSIEEMQLLFKGWDPILSRFLSYVPEVEKWKLMHREEMSSWVNDRNNLVFLGDACHPMLPYLAQGANSSLEDGAVLGTLLGQISNPSQIGSALATFQKLRKSRGEAIVRETWKQRHDFHLPDGPEQEERDRVLRLGPGGSEKSQFFPSRWTCPQVQPWLYGYDATKDAENSSTVLAHL
ncbi:FAD/NAD(P)-binding domain-containing protein [Thozetella sp. PMI_491]|nr:FAD/NAD(P)-binding domain-containing protein [Thozetella sp. PMI_491]